MQFLNKRNFLAGILLYTSILSNPLSLKTVTGSATDDQAWGPEGGWSRNELLFLSNASLFNLEFYSDRYYSETATNTDIEYPPYKEIIPQGLYKSLEGKTVVTSYWSVPTSNSGKDNVEYDSMKVEKDNISGAFGWANQLGEYALHLDAEGVVKSLTIDADFGYEVDHVLYEHENGLPVKRSLYVNDSLNYWVDLRYNDQHEVIEIVDNDFNGTGGLGPVRKNEYTYENGTVVQIDEHIDLHRVGKEIHYRWNISFNEQDNVKTMVRKWVEKDETLKIYTESDSIVVNYNEAGQITTYEKHETKPSRINNETIFNWVPSKRRTFVYNSSGQISEVFEYVWDTGIYEWVQHDTYGYAFYEYDDNKNLIRFSRWRSDPVSVISYKDGYPESIIQRSNDGSLYSTRYFRYYDNSTDLAGRTTSPKLSLLFQNGIVSLNEAALVSPLNLYSLSGKLIAEIQPIRVGRSVVYDIQKSGTARGVYIGKIKADNVVIQRRFIMN